MPYGPNDNLPDYRLDPPDDNYEAALLDFLRTHQDNVDAWLELTAQLNSAANLAQLDSEFGCCHKLVAGWIRPVIPNFGTKDRLGKGTR